MPSWKKRFLRIKDGEQTTSDDTQDEESSIRLLDELSPPSEEDLKALKRGARVQFYHYKENSTDGLWMEGTVLQRITKKEQATRTNFSTNWFNVGELKLLVNLGSASGEIPSKISIHLSRNKCWKLATERSDNNITQLLSSMDKEERVYHLDAKDLALIEPHVDHVEEDQHAAEEEIPDGATAMIRLQQDGVDQTIGIPTTSREFVTATTSPDGVVATTRTQQGGGDQINGMPTVNQDFITTVPPPYQELNPSLTDESTLRASNSVNIDQPQERHQVDIHS